MSYISNMINAVVLNIIAVIALQTYDPDKNTLISIVAHFFKKSPTFTGRTRIWIKARNMIKQSPFIGHGFPFDYLQTIGIEHCHSTYLTILYERGILGILCLGYVLYSLAKNLMHLEDKKLKCAFCAWLFIVMVMAQFETYRIIFLVSYGALISYFSIYDHTLNSTALTDSK